MAFTATHSQRVAIVISSDDVDAALTNFPVLLTEDSLPSDMFDADGSSPAQNGGGDIRFSSDYAGANQIACEVVSFVTDNNPANGTAQIYVLVPNISATLGAKIYLWWNTGTTDSQPAVDASYGRDEVWANSFAAVYHMEQDPSGSSPQITDSTGNGNDLTASGTMTGGDLVAALVGNGIEFDGTDDRFDKASLVASLPSTIEAIVTMARPAAFATLIDLAQSGTATDHVRLYVQTDGKISAQRYNGTTAGNAVSTTALPAVGTPTHHVAGVFRDGRSAIHIDGVEEAVDTTAVTGVGSINALRVGGLNWSTNIQYAAAIMDEVRISTVERSVAWGKATYSNLTNPASFAAWATAYNLPAAMHHYRTMRA